MDEYQTVVQVTAVDPGRVPAWPEPADLEILILEGKHPGKRFPYGSLESFAAKVVPVPVPAGPTEVRVVESHVFEAGSLPDLGRQVQEFFGVEHGADASWIGKIVPGGHELSGNGVDRFLAILFFLEENGPCYVVVQVKHGAVLKADVYAML